MPTSNTVTDATVTDTTVVAATDDALTYQTITDTANELLTACPLSTSNAADDTPYIQALGDAAIEKKNVNLGSSRMMKEKIL